MRKYSIIFILIIIFAMPQFAHARSYTTTDLETISGTKYWTGFKWCHYGFTHPADAYKGKDTPFRYEYTYIDSTGIHKGISEGSHKAVGYGTFAMDYKIHILGLLHYIIQKIGTKNYDTGYTKLVYDLTNPLAEPTNNPMSMKDACISVANSIALNSYNRNYRDTEFKKFWEECFEKCPENKKNVLLELENEFYLKAYGESAISYLSSTFNIKAERIGNPLYEPAFRGAIFSIMEERYRRKNLGGKTNLKLQVAAGEVLPFLIYVDCERTENGEYINKKFMRKKGINKEGKMDYEMIDISEITSQDIDQIIDGAYQYMVYVYGNEGTSNKINTVLNSINTNDEDDEDDSMSDFVDEYIQLTCDGDFPYLRGKELQEFLSRVDEIRSLYKKSSSNSYGAFGEDEEYNIESDKNFTEAMRDMRNAMESTIGYSAFTGMQGEKNIARTYLMAKNIMDSTGVRNEYSYYDIGTNVITRTPGLEDNVYLLSDFQKVELVSPLEERDEEMYPKKTYNDTDEDGLFDYLELSDKIDINIEEFVRKTLYADLFGKAPETPDNTNHINIMMAQYKMNVNTHFDNARCNNEAEYEFWLNPQNELTVTAYKYKSNPCLKDTDFDGLNDGKGSDYLDNLLQTKNENQISYDQMKYDKNPLDNSFKGKMNSTRLSGSDAINVDMTMDYRYFLMSNKNYYDELSTMSLLMANSIYMKDSGIEIENGNNEKVGDRYKNLRIKDLMKFFGFQNVKTYYMGSSTDSGYEEGDITRNYKDTHKGRVALGYKNIEYHGIEKSVIGIIIRGTAEDDDWDNDFDMGDLKLRDILQEDYEGGYENYTNAYDDISASLNVGILDKYDKKYSNELLHFAGGYLDWKHKYHHAGFDIVANRILEVIEKYIDDEGCSDMNGDIVYWVTGHSMGAGVANIVAAELLHSANGINDRTDNVYCYTFAAPNTFYITDNTYEREHNAIEGKKVKEQYREPKTNKYRCIFNIVNDDDFVPKVPMEECNWTKYGRTAKYSIEKTLKSSLYGPQLNKSYNEYVFNTYKSNYALIDGTINAFNSIFLFDKNDMRNATYTFNYLRPDCYIKSNSFYEIVNGIYEFNTNKPYQKLEPITLIQYQTPAYFMQSVASAMHEYNESGEKKEVSFNGKIINYNQLKIVQMKFALRYTVPKYITLITGGFGYIENPHMLESYYTLTKEIDTTDFR